MALRASQLLLAAALCGLAGCVPPGSPNAPVFGAGAGGPGASARPRVAILLPLTGPSAPLAQGMLNAAQLALGTDGPQLDVRDTHGTPDGAAQAAAASVDSHDMLIIGPLTSPETAAAAAAAHGIPMLAFTSDPQQARPGVWVLGVTPEQQVTRLVLALKRDGKTRIAAVLPDNPFGAALADGLNTAAQSEAAPIIRRYATGQFAMLDAALRDISGQPARGAPPVTAIPGGPTPDVAPAPAPPPILPFDALLLAESGPNLRSAAAVLPTYGLTLPAVRIIGPTIWARDQANLAGVPGAWYAAPDPAARVAFERAYAARYGSPPPSTLLDLAFDAASLARVLATHPGILTQPQGFAGADGLFALRADGRVRRGLAVFEVGPGGARIVDPSPTSFSAGS